MMKKCILFIFAFFVTGFALAQTVTLWGYQSARATERNMASSRLHSPIQCFNASGQVLSYKDGDRGFWIEKVSQQGKKVKVLHKWNYYRANRSTVIGLRLSAGCYRVFPNLKHYYRGRKDVYIYIGTGKDANADTSGYVHGHHYRDRRYHH